MESSAGELCEPSRLRLRLLQVKPHVHLAVHRGGDSEMLVCLLDLARPPVEFAEAEVAMGDERAQTELPSECAGVVVSSFSSSGGRRITGGGDLAEEPERHDLVSALAAVSRHRERVGRHASGLFEIAQQEVCLPEPRQVDGLVCSLVRPAGLHGPLQEVARLRQPTVECET